MLGLPFATSEEEPSIHFFGGVIVMSQQTGNLSSTERVVSALFGLSFALLASRRGHPVWRILTGAAGATLLVRSYTGNCAIKAALMGQAPLRYDRAVDESVEGSFPASDPPASRLADIPPVNAEAKWQAARAAQQAD
jgi:hypothetical protein